MKVALLSVLLLALPAIVYGGDLTPVSGVEYGRDVVRLPGRDEAVLLSPDVTVARIAKSRLGDQFVIELRRSRAGYGQYHYGCIVCEYDRNRSEWSVAYRMMADSLTLWSGRECGVAFVYDFERLDAVTVILSTLEGREFPAGDVRTWEVWDVRNERRIRVLEDAERPDGQIWKQKGEPGATDNPDSAQ